MNQKNSEKETGSNSGSAEKTQESKGNAKAKHMPFTDHLEELRMRLFKIIGSIVGTGLICYIFAPRILNILTGPAPEGIVLQYLRPTGGFIIYLKVSFFAGVLISMPVIIYQFWQFIAPGLFPNEKKRVIPIVFFTVFSFAVGAIFAYSIVIPMGLQFLSTFQTETMVPNWTVDDFISFVTMLMLVFGLVFELPLVALFLGKLGLIDSKMMTKYRRHALFGAVVFGAVLTPPDFITQIALAIPLWLLYEISIVLVRIFCKKSTEEDI